MARVVTKIGNVFSVKLDDNNKKYFQYVANDLTQLNSDVIRVFKKVYPINENPDLSEVVKDEIEFYAHCVTSLGIKLGVWEKAGKAAIEEKLDILFRGSRDSGIKLGDEPVTISDKWYVWKINEDFKYVGILEGENKKAEIGMVINPLSIIHRMRTGKYDFIYPGY
jgi:hypothetical protein